MPHNNTNKHRILVKIGTHLNSSTVQVPTNFRKDPKIPSLLFITISNSKFWLWLHFPWVCLLIIQPVPGCLVGQPTREAHTTSVGFPSQPTSPTSNCTSKESRNFMGALANVWGVPHERVIWSLHKEWSVILLNIWWMRNTCSDDTQCYWWGSINQSSITKRSFNLTLPTIL